MCLVWSHSHKFAARPNFNKLDISPPPMAGKKKKSGAVIYNLLLKEVSQINKTLPEERKLSLKERREFVSKNVYPKFKGGLREVNGKKRLTGVVKLRTSVERKIRRMPKKEGCDILGLDPETYQEINYFEIDEFLGSILPNCVYAKVSAGYFGETNIFNTRDYDYKRTGVADITDAINDEMAELIAQGKDPQSWRYVYNGMIQLRPKKQNDGTPENYYLDMILYVNDTPLEDRESIEYPTKRPKRKKGSASIRKIVNQRIRKVQSDKQRVKRIRKNVSKQIDRTQIIMKSSVTDKKGKEKYRKKIFDQEKRKLEKQLKNGHINKKTYQSLLKRIRGYYKQ